MRLILAALPLLLCVAQPAVAAAAAEPLAIDAVARRLDPQQPGHERVGALRALGVLELSSPDRRFGGLSGLLVSPDGARLEAVSDRGDWIAARILSDAEGRLTGLEGGRIAPLTGPDGAPLADKRWQDAESLADLGSALLVSFERDHRVWRYPRAAGGVPGRPVALPPLPGAGALPANDGLEAIETLSGGPAAGSLLAIVSKSDGNGRYPAHLLRDGAWQALWYARTAPYEPTGAAALPDGDLLVLERRFSLLGGLGVRLVRVPAAAIVPGATLEGRELAVLTPPLTVDNMEGVATRRGPGGRTLVYLLSDDNFNPLQRTLLMLFELEE